MKEPSFITMRGPALTKPSIRGAYRVTLTARARAVRLYQAFVVVRSKSPACCVAARGGAIPMPSCMAEASQAMAAPEGRSDRPRHTRQRAWRVPEGARGCRRASEETRSEGVASRAIAGGFVKVPLERSREAITSQQNAECFRL